MHKRIRPHAPLAQTLKPPAPEVASASVAWQMRYVERLRRPSSGAKPTKLTFQLNNSAGTD